MGYELRPIRRQEIDAFLVATIEAFQEEPHDDELALWRRQIEPERTLAAFADGTIVATSGVLSLELAVPGAIVPMAGVTAVGVHPDHRGRGLLDRMMRGHLDALRRRGGEAVSALWASEAGLYGRWGFGAATGLADLTIRSREAALRPGAPPTRPRSAAPGELLGAMREVFDAVLPGRPGLLRRDDLGWEEAISDFEHERDGAGRLRAIVVDDADGPAGYATFAVRKRWTNGRADGVIELRELVARTPDAAAVLWGHLLTLSLTRSVHWAAAPLDDALPHMLMDSRAIEARAGDALYVRLVDLPRALSQRTYGGRVDIVLEVDDTVCPWNAGRWRLRAEGADARCDPTDSSPDLSLTATELGAAYVGGTTLTVLAAAGRVASRTPDVLAATSHAFQAPRAPWSFQQF